MSWLLLSNDDGVDSPALLPFAAALERALGMPVRISVPATERSWSGKAVTRHAEVSATRVRRGGREVLAVDGTPADAVQLGLYGAFAEEHAGAPPRAVFTGVNLGFNCGSGFLASSGTVWAAAEASLAGLPTVAVSTGTVTDWHRWRTQVAAPAAGADWERVASVAADVIAAIGDSDLLEHCDLVSVNAPWEATLATPRRVTRLSPLVYGPLFEPGDGPGVWRPRPQLDVHVPDDTDGDGDVAALADGVVSITPVVLPTSNQVPDRTRAGLERS